MRTQSETRSVTYDFWARSRRGLAFYFIFLIAAYLRQRTLGARETVTQVRSIPPGRTFKTMEMGPMITFSCKVLSLLFKALFHTLRAVSVPVPD